MFAVSFTQAARAEMISACEWYENEVAGLGLRFVEAVTVERISVYPRQFPVV